VSDFDDATLTRSLRLLCPCLLALAERVVKLAKFVVLHSLLLLSPLKTATQASFLDNTMTNNQGCSYLTAAGTIVALVPTKFDVF